MNCDDDLCEIWQQLLAGDCVDAIACRLLGEVITLRRLCSNLEVELARSHQLVRDERRVA
jgi:hypothetical protein